MEIHADSDLNEIISDKYIYLDNDFLSLIYKNDSAFSFILSFPSNCNLFIDPLTKFEFLRGIYVPREKELREQFLNNAEMFNEPVNHNDLFQKIQEKALTLSLIYSHEGRTSGVSIVDLLLAGRIVSQDSSSPLLITGNKKDFPCFVFDTLSVINVEHKDGSIQPFCVIKVNKQKLENCISRLLY